MIGWEDVTRLSKEASYQLSHDLVKPMLAIDGFSLHESMSAAELMDSKMDQCYNLPQLQSLTVNSLFDLDAPSVSWDAILGLCFVLFKNTVLFLNGNSIMETTHRCGTLWSFGLETIAKLPDFKFSFVSVVSRCTVKIISLVISAMLSADIYEDEDFSPSFRQFLLTDDEANQVEHLLIALDTMAIQIGKDSTIPEPLKEFFSAYVCFLKSSIEFYSDLESLIQQTISECTHLLRSKKLATAEDVYISYLKLDNVSLSESINLQKFRDILDKNEAVLLSVKILNDSISLLLTSPSYSEDAIVMEAENIFCKDYLPKLVTSAPKRRVDEVTTATQLQKFQTLHMEIAEIYRNFVVSFLQLDENGTVLSALKISQTFESFFEICCDVSAKRTHLIPRSYYVSFLYLLAVHMDKFLVNSLLQKSVPEKLLFVNSSVIEWLRAAPALAAWEMIKLTAVNRNRFFARLEHVFQLWGNVVTESLYLDEQVNEEIMSNPEYSDIISPDKVGNHMYWFATWSVIHSTNLMDLHMKLMIEMSIIELKEFDYFYWYWDFIFSTHSHALDKMKSQIIQLKLKSVKNKKEEMAKLLESARFENDSYYRGCGQVCRGNFRLVIACKYLGLIPDDEQSLMTNRFTSASVIFANRFKSFQEIINPTPLSYHEYASTVSKDLTQLASSTRGESRAAQALQIINSAIICFQNAKGCFDEARKAGIGKLALVDMLKTTIASQMQASKLKKIVELSGTGSNIRCSLKYPYSKHFSVFEFEENVKP